MKPVLIWPIIRLIVALWQTQVFKSLCELACSFLYAADCFVGWLFNAENILSHLT